MFLAGFDGEEAIMDLDIICDVVLQFLIAATLGIDFEFPF